jgi:hypothetical protein
MYSLLFVLISEKFYSLYLYIYSASFKFGKLLKHDLYFTGTMGKSLCHVMNVSDFFLPLLSQIYRPKIHYFKNFLLQ